MSAGRKANDAGVSRGEAGAGDGQWLGKGEEREEAVAGENGGEGRGPKWMRRNNNKKNIVGETKNRSGNGDRQTNQQRKREEYQEKHK